MYACSAKTIAIHVLRLPRGTIGIKLSLIKEMSVHLGHPTGNVEPLISTAADHKFDLDPDLLFKAG